MADSFSEREIESFKYLRSLGMTPQEALDVLRICLGGGLFSKQGDEFILMGKDGKRMALPLMLPLPEKCPPPDWLKTMRRASPCTASS